MDQRQEEVALVNAASHLSPFRRESETGVGTSTLPGPGGAQPPRCAAGRGQVGAVCPGAAGHPALTAHGSLRPSWGPEGEQRC